MDFIGIEEIQPYENIYEYKIYEYDDVIELGNEEKFICDIKFIQLNINPVYKDRGIDESVGYIVVENLSKNIKMSSTNLEKDKKFHNARNSFNKHERIVYKCNFRSK